MRYKPRSEESVSTVQRLEDLANAAVQRLDVFAERSARSTTMREIGLTLQHLAFLRNTHTDILSSLLEDECRLGTELHGIARRTPPYSPAIFPEREKFVRGVLALEKERRQVRLKYFDRLHLLHDRLLVLLDQHLSFDTHDRY